MNDLRIAICENCEEEKTIPLIRIADEFDIEGLCDDCVELYGMQIGDRVRLSYPAGNGKTEVLFIGTAVDAIRARRSDGLTELIEWGKFERLK